MLRRADADAVDAVIGSFLAEVAGFASLARIDDPGPQDLAGQGGRQERADEHEEEEPLAGALSVDGKTARGARQPDGRAVHLLSALIRGTRLVVAQRDVAHKTNEIPEVRELLGPLGLRGWAVTLDAMHCQKETARFLVEDKGAAYVFTGGQGQPAGPVRGPGRLALAGRAGQPRHDRPRPRPPGTAHDPGAARARGHLALCAAGVPRRTVRL